MHIKGLQTILFPGLACVAVAQATPPAPKDPQATPHIDKRQANPQKRIDAGVASGSLTQKEVDRLEARQARNAKLEDKAKADGVVTHKERVALKQCENKTNRHIARQKHDRQKVAPAG